MVFFTTGCLTYKQKPENRSKINSMTRLTFYHREGCHLCDQMVDALKPLAKQLNFTLIYVDIDEDPALKQRFNDKVPVLMFEDDVVCCHFLDEKALRQALTDG